MSERVEPNQPSIGSAVLGPHHAGSSRALWADAMGRLATRALQAILVVTVSVLVLYVILSLSKLVVPLLIALIVAAALHPLMRLLKPRMPNGVAAALTLLLVGVGMGGAVSFALVRILAQADMLKQELMAGVQKLMDYLHHGPLPITDQQIVDARHSIIDFFTSSTFGAHALAEVHGLVELCLQVILGLFILFYLLKDGKRIADFLTSSFAPALRERVRYSGGEGIDVLGGYLRGTAIVGLVDTVLIGGALWILGVPLTLTLSILVFIGAFIPVVGATVSGFVAALVALVTVDLNAALWVVGVVLAVNQLEGNVLSPLVIGRWMHLHALVVLLALAAGAVLGGITGTFLAVPLTAMGWTILKAWTRPPQDGEPASATETKLQ